MTSASKPPVWGFDWLTLRPDPQPLGSHQTPPIVAATCSSDAESTDLEHEPVGSAAGVEPRSTSLSDPTAHAPEEAVDGPVIDSCFVADASDTEPIRDQRRRDTRFKPGRSGNPKGRPKGSRGRKHGSSELQIDELIRKEADRLIEVSEHGQRYKIRLIEGLIRKRFASAMSGNDRAAYHLIGRLHSNETLSTAIHPEFINKKLNKKEIDTILSHNQIIKASSNEFNGGCSKIIERLSHEQRMKLGDILRSINAECIDED